MQGPRIAPPPLTRGQILQQIAQPFVPAQTQLTGLQNVWSNALASPPPSSNWLVTTPDAWPVGAPPGIFIAQVEGGNPDGALGDGTWKELGRFNTLAEADAAAKKYDDANPHSLRLTRILEAGNPSVPKDPSTVPAGGSGILADFANRSKQIQDSLAKDLGSIKQLAKPVIDAKTNFEKSLAKAKELLGKGAKTGRFAHRGPVCLQEIG